jgi:hypothetical protein
MLDAKQFSRRVEDFDCGHCGTPVVGNGYTNHCTNCLWSMHVDVNPGDRAADCGGLMAPVGLEIRGGSNIIEHQCTECDHSRKNKTSPGDNLDRIIDLSCGAYDYRKDVLFIARQETSSD